MVPRLQWRRIGGVNIFELQGIFAEPWLNRNRQEMSELLELHPGSSLLMNLREVERIDRPGAETILKAVRLTQKGGILGQNLSTYFVAEHMSPNEPIPIFEREKEAIGYFEKEFAEPDENSEVEKRHLPRIDTALPVEFELKDEKDLFFFEAVVLNLGEGGFFAQFLDSKTEELAARVLDPYDLKMLKIQLSLKDGKILKTEGKVLRTWKDAQEWGGVAVQFYHLPSEGEGRIRAFLARGDKNHGGKNQ